MTKNTNTVMNEKSILNSKEAMTLGRAYDKLVYELYKTKNGYFNNPEDQVIMKMSINDTKREQFDISVQFFKLTGRHIETIKKTYGNFARMSRLLKGGC